MRDGAVVFSIVFHFGGFDKRKTPPHIRAPRGHTKAERCSDFDEEETPMNQTIRCSVETCRHHSDRDVCQLDAISVCPNCDCHSGKCDESMCGSYECRKK